MPQQGNGDSEATPNQASYTPTPYNDSSWEIVGTFENQLTFEPMSFQVISEHSMNVDPMFADYGGLPASGEKIRSHSKKGEHFAPTRRRELEEQESEVIDPSKYISIADHERLLEEARAAAYTEGQHAAIAENDERLRGLEERYIGVLEDIGAQLNENIRSIEQQSVGLALQISEKLVGTVVEVNPEYLVPIVKQAIKLTGGAVVKSVKVSQQDFEFISLLNLPKEFKEFDGSWKFEADETVKSGCIVVTENGEVDYRIDEAWERIRDQVVKVI